ncbi:MAG: hypothetical protein K8R54_13365 [Bacteroidales bacterium]|nr:hypothetical protein [Bacteroidales bacterium]
MISEFCSDFNNYLMSNYSYKKSPAHYNDINNTICAKRKAFDLYLKVKQNSKFWDNETVVIARIYFFIQRNGNGH